MSKPRRSRARKIGVGVTIAITLLGIAELALRAVRYPPASPVYYDPAIGLRYRPNQRRSMLYEGQGIATVTTNDRGFRSPEFQDEKAEGVLRVVCLGDSFTLGWGVDDDRTYPAVLQSQLDQRVGHGRCEVINLGQPDFNTVNEARIYKLIGRTLDPDVVILGFVLNDLMPETMLAFDTGAWASRVLRECSIAQALRRTLLPGLGVSQPGHAAENRQRRKEYFRNELEVLRDPDGAIGSGHWKVSMDAFREIASTVRTDGAELLMVVFPGSFQLGPVDTPPAQRRLAREANSLGVPFLDLLPMFNQVGVPAYSRADNQHPSELGYATAAEAIADELSRLGLIRAVTGR